MYRGVSTETIPEAVAASGWWSASVTHSALPAITHVAEAATEVQTTEFYNMDYSIDYETAFVERNPGQSANDVSFIWQTLACAPGAFQ